MTRRPPARAAFTLIELIVVIAIIAVLGALTMAAVQRFRVLGPRTKALSEISQLDEACSAFKNKFKFNPPTVFTIPSKKDSTDPNFVLLSRMFDRWMRGSAEGTATGLPSAGTTLTGSACLVYFLGGPTGTGWAIDAPVAAGPNAAAKHTFYDFDAKRVDNAGTNQYFDPFGTPYIYHGSLDGGGYPTVSVNGVLPFKDAAGKWVNPRGVQIICAGPNIASGPGGGWSPGGGAYSFGQPGGDDLANFNDGKPLSSQ